jgi:hypothetical protein
MFRPISLFVSKRQASYREAAPAPWFLNKFRTPLSAQHLLRENQHLKD